MTSFFGTFNSDTLSGSAGADSIGGLDGNDSLTGGKGQDSLDGGKGVDTLKGGQGSDVYFVDNAGDVVIDDISEANVVRSTVSYVLPNGLGRLELIGSAANGTGNETDNALMGSKVANVLRGGGGNDNVHGFEGNDSLNGDDGNDILVGESGADTAEGGSGNDTLDGLTGNDRLTDNSTTSAEQYVFFSGDGADTIVDSGGKDSITIFQRVGVTMIQTAVGRDLLDLEITFNGSSDRILIKNARTSSGGAGVGRIETVNFLPTTSLRATGLATGAAGDSVLRTQAGALVQAMAAFGTAGAEAVAGPTTSTAPATLLAVGAG